MSRPGPSEFPGKSGLICPIIPDHTLIRPIGKGSYGDVWLARNVTGIYRAVKVVYQKSFDTPRPSSREFSGIKKFEPISRSHEGLMDILQIGINEKEGYFYYVMELADDLVTGAQIDPDHYTANTLANQITGPGQLPISECHRLGLALTSALGHLHKKGLVHRDIKPSNIIFVQGIPKLADIGLVTDLREARSFVGTEGYIPPEGPGTTQADLYSLGKLLYEISTGKDRNDFPQLPPDLAQRADLNEFLELNEVIIRACHNNPEERYPDAESMHEDLLLLQGGKSVRRLRLLERRFKVFGKAAIFLTALLALGAAVIYQANREQKRSAEIRQRSVGNFVAHGTKHLEEGDLLASLPWFVAALRLDMGGTEEETHRLRIAAILRSAPKIAQMYFQKGAINGVEAQPGTSRFALASATGEVVFWNSQSGRTEGSWQAHLDEVEKVSFSRDGQGLLTASDDGTAVLWDVNTRKALLTLVHPSQVNSARFNCSGDKVITAAGDPVARIWDRRDGRLLLGLTNQSSLLWQAAFSADDRYVITAGDFNAELWNLTDLPPSARRLREKDWFYFASFSPDSRFIVTATDGRVAEVWSVSNASAGVRFARHSQGITSAKFNPDGSAVLTTSLDATACVWSAHTGEPLSPPLLHSGRVLDGCFAGPGQVMTVCWDGTARLWKLPESKANLRFQEGVYSTDGNLLLQFVDGAVKVKRSVSGRRICRSFGLSPDWTNFIWAPDGKCFLALRQESAEPNGPGGAGQVWDAGTGKPVTAPFVLGVDLHRASLSPDGLQLLTVEGPTARLWNLSAGRAASLPLQHPGAVSNALFVSGTEVITVAASNVYLWNVTEPAKPRWAMAAGNLVSSVVASPDQRLLVICTADDMYTECDAQVVDIRTGKPAAPRLHHTDGILGAAFSPDGQKIVTASEDYSAIVWDARTGRQLTAGLQHRNQVLTAAFSSNGRWVATVSQDRAARLWDALSGEPLSPPIRFPDKVSEARFLENDRFLLVKKSSGGGWIYELPREGRPVEDLTLLAHLLAGQRGNEPYGVQPDTYPSLQSIWERLRSKYGSDLNVPGAPALHDADENGTFQAKSGH